MAYVYIYVINIVIRLIYREYIYIKGFIAGYRNVSIALFTT